MKHLYRCKYYYMFIKSKFFFKFQLQSRDAQKLILAPDTYYDVEEDEGLAKAILFK